MDVYEKIRMEIENRYATLGKSPMIVALDGRCASGKTTLAARLAGDFSCTVFHMDDFFLRPEQRTNERLSTPGENVDHERFLEEVMLPLRQGGSVSYRPFDCGTFTLKEAVSVEPASLIIVEGAYSCHPSLWNFYDLRIFCTVSREEQQRRIALRNGETALRTFLEKWIPLEEAYFEAYRLEERCDLRAVLK